MNINTPNFQSYQGPTSGSRTTQNSSVDTQARVDRTSRADNARSVNEANQRRQSHVDERSSQNPQQGLSQSQYQSVVEAHQQHQTTYDQPQGNQRAAISSYQSVLNAPKREEIQRLVGIDTFA